MAYSILSDNGLRYTTLRIKSLNGDDVWEIPYQEDWSDVYGWINSEKIEMITSNPDISTTNPNTGTFALNPFTEETSANIDAADLNLKPATIPYYDPTLTRMVYLRDSMISESGEGLVENIVIEEISSGKEIWVREDFGQYFILASWSADGTQVAIHDSSRLIVVNLEDGWERFLPQDLDVISPVWSSDGRYVAVKTYDTLAIYDTINDVLTDYCLHNKILGFAWSPKSHQLAVSGWLHSSSYILIVDIEAKIATIHVESDFVLLGWSEP